MTIRSLLARLETPDPPGTRTATESLSGVLDDIRRNLRMMLNTYHGGSRTVPDFGIEDLTDVSRGEKSARRVADDIRRAILRYEPRLADVDVRVSEGLDNEPFTLCFDIHAHVMAGERATSIVFRSVVETTGEISVTRPKM